jgi:hypothetical protein
MASFTTAGRRDLNALAQRRRPDGPCAEALKPRRGERLTLADGVDVEIRPLERSDREALASAVARAAARRESP